MNSQVKAKKLALGPFFPINIGKSLLLFLLTLGVVFSALAVVYIKHLNRSLHIELQALKQSRDNLHIEWSRLLLEQGTLGSDVRVEKIAREELGMTVPDAKEIVVIKP